LLFIAFWHLPDIALAPFGPSSSNLSSLPKVLCPRAGKAGRSQQKAKRKIPSVLERSPPQRVEQAGDKIKLRITA
jgi:hypothetical protein